MKVKCENSVVCGCYACGYNENGYCSHIIVAMDELGRCVLTRTKKEAKQKSTTSNESSGSY